MCGACSYISACHDVMMPSYRGDMAKAIYHCLNKPNTITHHYACDRLNFLQGYRMSWLWANPTKNNYCLGTTIHTHTSSMCTLSGNNEIILSVQSLTHPVLPDVYDAARWQAMNTMNCCAEKNCRCAGHCAQAAGPRSWPRRPAE